MIGARPFAVTAMTVWLAGCGVAASSSGSTDVETAPPASLDDARQLWQEKGVEHYAITAQMTCYCPQDLVQPIRLEVAGDKVLTAEGLRQPLQNLSSEDAQHLTVEGLFLFVEDAQRRGAHKLDVIYNPEYGFPARIDYDEHPMMADEERQYRLSDFEPGTTR